MPNVEGPLPTMLFQRIDNETGKVDWAKFLGGTFDLNKILGGLEEEAGQKGCILLVQVSLIPAEEFFDDDGAADSTESQTNGDVDQQQED